MEKVTGRSDDMLIIRGVNVFPSQIEAVLMEVEGTEPHYQIIVDRKGALDDVEVKVEVNEKIFSDEVKVLDQLSKQDRRPVPERARHLGQDHPCGAPDHRPERGQGGAGRGQEEK